jgi:hypothetical protein
MTADRIRQWTVGDVQIHRIVEVADHADPIVAAGLHKFIDAPGYRVCDETTRIPLPGRV